MPPVLCDYCEYSNHDTHTCPFRAYVDTTCASFEKKVNEMTDQIIETMKARIAACSQSFNQNRETYSEIDSSLGSRKPNIRLYDDFKPSYSVRPDLNEHMCLPNLEQQSDLSMPLSSDLASLTSSPKYVTEDNFCEFDMGEQSDTVSELDISITPEVEPYDLDDSKGISQELCDEVTELPILDFDDDILYVEYESFSYGLDVTEGLDMGFHLEYESFSFDLVIPDLLFQLDDNILCVEHESFSGEFETHGSSSDGVCADYESFSFNPIQTDFLFEYYKYDFVESEMIATKNFALDQTHAHVGFNRLMKFAPPILPRLFVYDDIVSMPMTSILARSENVHLLSNWAQLLDKLR